MKYAVYRHRDGCLEILDSQLIKGWKLRQNILAEFDSDKEARKYVVSNCRFMVVNLDGEVMIIHSDTIADYPSCEVIRGVATLKHANELVKLFCEEN